MSNLTLATKLNVNHYYHAVNHGFHASTARMVMRIQNALAQTPAPRNDEEWTFLAELAGFVAVESSCTHR